MYPPQYKKPQPKPKKKSDACRVTIKKKKDGTVVKEISGNCSREKLELLGKED